MLFITDEQDLNLNTEKAAVYFYASWMPFHKKMLNMISKVEEKHKNIKFYAVDVDFFKGLCKRFEVSEIPTVIIYNNFKEAKRIKGLLLTSAFKSAFLDICK